MKWSTFLDSYSHCRRFTPPYIGKGLVRFEMGIIEKSFHGPAHQNIFNDVLSVLESFFGASVAAPRSSVRSMFPGERMMAFFGSVRFLSGDRLRAPETGLLLRKACACAMEACPTVQSKTCS